MARLTGAIGTIVLALGSYSHSVNSNLLDASHPTLLAENLIDAESSFRLGFVSGLLMETVFIGYALLLFRLFRNVNQNYAFAMLILALVPAPIFLLNQLNQFAILLAAKAGLLEQMIFFKDLHENGGLIVSIFFGLWLLPLGILVYQSRFLPKVLGILLMAGCFGYLIHFFQGFLLPGQEVTLWTSPALILSHISELSLMIWLLVRGINPHSLKQVEL